MIKFTTKVQSQYNVVVAGEVLTLWHGGNLDFNEENVSHKKGRWEFGPGLYLTTHYNTAKKYAKGSRKLYQVVVQKGVDIKDVDLPVDTVLAFVNTYVIKAKKRDILERIEKRTSNGMISADTFLNIMINEEAIKNINTSQLRNFLVQNGIDYSIQDSAFGWHERMLVIFNMKKIVSKKVVKSTEKIEEFDLPTDFKETL